jgi:hypothetical protein
MGVNTNNINPESLKFVDRKYTYGDLIRPLREQGDAHPDDPAPY